MAFQPVRGTVPHFKLRPHPVLVGAILFTLFIGFLLAMSFLSQEDGTGRHRHHAVVVSIITGFIVLSLLIIATSKMWFPHLWKRNSNHDRHKQHTRHHPSVRDREYRRRR